MGEEGDEVVERDFLQVQLFCGYYGEIITILYWILNYNSLI